jgi:peptide/nickel transport system substrate-binding protein
MHKRIVFTFSAFILSLAVLMSASPAAAENALRFTSIAGAAATMDPHSWYEAENRVATEQVYEALLDIDSNLAIVPQLALTWKPLNPTTWEFELRPDVTFHDGTPFTAEDVVFSIERARAEGSDVSVFVDGIAMVEAIADHTVRFTTAGPDPSLWLKLAEIAIMSRAWAQEHNVTKPADFVRARQEETYASRHANGTGPFMLEEFEPHGNWVMVRNPAWWDAAAHPLNIDRIIHIWKDDPENVAALLAGDIDLLQAVPYWALNQIRRTPGLKLAYGTKLLTMYFGLDQGSAELRSSKVKGRNPFKDKRVRQAMAYAIDFEPVLHDLMSELFIPAGMLVAPGVNGYDLELDQPPSYDPERARVLLAEAGYPDGFDVTLDCPSDWGDDEIAECKGAAGQLGKIGIEIAINFLSTDELYAKLYKQRQSDFFMDGEHMEPDSKRVLREWFGQNYRNLTGYANPRVDQLIEKIQTEMVTYARDAYLAEAWRIVTEDLVYLTIRHGVSVFAMRKNLEIPPDPFDVPRFRLAWFKEQSKSAQQ